MKSAVLALGVLVMASSAAAQPPPGPAVAGEAGGGQARLRYQIRIMEGVLERAVQHGAEMLGTELRTMPPDAISFFGPPRVRGFRLDGYGVFFNVEVPTLRRTVTWTMRTLQQQNLGIPTAMESLRRHVRSLSDVRARQDLEAALKVVELQMSPVSDVTSAQIVAPDDEAPVQDPGEVYTAQVKRALMDAMIDHSGPLTLGPDEWLTIAAQDSGYRLAPMEVAESFTVMLRVKGSDLQAEKAGKLTRDEVMQRIVVQLF